MNPQRIAALFSRLIDMEIDNHSPLDFETVFDFAGEHINHEDDDAIEQTQALAEALDLMLMSARALS